MPMPIELFKATLPLAACGVKSIIGNNNLTGVRRMHGHAAKIGALLSRRALSPPAARG